jgi:hypothetical protein
MCLGGSVFSKLKKEICKFQKNDINFSCTYYLDTYSCKFSRKNAIIYVLHKKDKMSKNTTMIGFLLFEEMQLFILSFFL